MLLIFEESIGACFVGSSTCGGVGGGGDMNVNDFFLHLDKNKNQHDEWRQ
jgi:hypothetical protein